MLQFASRRPCCPLSSERQKLTQPTSWRTQMLIASGAIESDKTMAALAFKHQEGGKVATPEKSPRTPQHCKRKAIAIAGSDILTTSIFMFGCFSGPTVPTSGSWITVCNFLPSLDCAPQLSCLYSAPSTSKQQQPAGQHRAAAPVARSTDCKHISQLAKAVQILLVRVTVCCLPAKLNGTLHSASADTKTARSETYKVASYLPATSIVQRTERILCGIAQVHTLACLCMCVAGLMHLSQHNSSETTAVQRRKYLHTYYLLLALVF